MSVFGHRPERFPATDKLCSVFRRNSQSSRVFWQFDHVLIAVCNDELKRFADWILLLLEYTHTENHPFLDTVTSFAS